MPTRRLISSRHDPWAAQRYRQLGVWGDRTIAEIVDGWATRTPDKTAAVDRQVRWSYEPEEVVITDEIPRTLAARSTRAWCGS